MPPGAAGGEAAAEEENYTGRLVRKWSRRAWHEGHVVSCTVLSDVRTEGGAVPAGATKLWRVHFDNIEDEDLLTPYLQLILAPGFRRGFAPKGGKGAEGVPPIVARKVAEVPPPRSAAGGAGVACSASGARLSRLRGAAAAANS